MKTAVKVAIGVASVLCAGGLAFVLWRRFRGPEDVVIDLARRLGVVSLRVGDTVTILDHAKGLAGGGDVVTIAGEDGILQSMTDGSRTVAIPGDATLRYTWTDDNGAQAVVFGVHAS